MQKNKSGKNGAKLKLLALMLAASMIAPYPAYAAEPAEETTEQAGEVQEDKEETADKKEAADNEETSDKEEAQDKEGEAAAADATAAEAAPAEEPAEGQAQTEEKKEPDAATSLADALNAQRMQIADDDIMQIRIGYEFSDGSFDEWARGTAFVVGPRDLLTRQSLINTKTESALFKKALKEKEELYKRIGVSLQDEVESEKHIKFYVEDREGHILAVSDTSIRNGLGLVVLKNSLDDIPAVVFADPSKTGYAAGAAVNIKAAGNMNGRCDVVTLSGIITAEAGTSANFSFQADDSGANVVGAPIYNDEGHVTGMVSEDGETMTAYTINAMETFLSTNGIQYRSIEKIQQELEEIEREAKEKEKAEADGEKEVDFSTLEKVVAAAEKIEDLSGYTKESADAFTSALEEAKKVLADKEATQEDVDIAAKKLNAAEGSLEEKPGILESIPLVPVVAGAAVIAAIIIVIVMVLKKKGSSDDDDEEDYSFEREAEKHSKKTGGRKKDDGSRRKKDISSSSGFPEEDDYSDYSDYDDEEKEPEYINDDGLDITDRGAGKRRRVTEEEDIPGVTYMEYDEDPDGKVSVLDEDGSGDTTLLSKRAYLVRKDNGKRIPITKDKFVIGKERKKVDYCIGGNGTISRTHAMIRTVNGKTYIEDLDSMNFTFIDGNQIPSGKSVLLKDGTMIRLSNVDFEFHDK